MEANELFDYLCSDYVSNNPSAEKILRLFTDSGEHVTNDHIAFRTLDDPRINIDVLAAPFIHLGYSERGSYRFNDKHLFARHYEKEGDAGAPRVFISQLLLGEVSPAVRETLLAVLDRLGSKLPPLPQLLYSGSVFQPVSFQTYNLLREESEYAAWFYVFGFRANHFTVSVNSLERFNTLEKVNTLLKDNGFKLNTSGGEIKGAPGDLLRQSSTLADLVKLAFVEGDYEVPCCYYEFAQRYPMPSGNLFSGFIAQSADKIFESTNFYSKDRQK